MSCIHTDTPEELFKELVVEAMDHQKIRSSPDSADYLVKLLDAFVCPEDLYSHAEVVPDRLASCAYWRCGELFEARRAGHRYCRKACRSRQNKWQRAQDRRARRSGRP